MTVFHAFLNVFTIVFLVTIVRVGIKAFVGTRMLNTLAQANAPMTGHEIQEAIRCNKLMASLGFAYIIESSKVTVHGRVGNFLRAFASKEDLQKDNPFDYRYELTERGRRVLEKRRRLAR